MSKLLAGAGSIATGGAVLRDIEREIDDTRAELHRILYVLEAKLSIRRR